MAFLIYHTYPVPSIPAGLDRSSVIPVAVPPGTEVVGIHADPPSVVVRGDVSQPLTATLRFVVVRSDIQLVGEETAARWVGSVNGYQTAAGREIYHVLLLP